VQGLKPNIFGIGIFPVKKPVLKHRSYLAVTLHGSVTELLFLNSTYERNHLKIVQIIIYISSVCIQCVAGAVLSLLFIWWSYLCTFEQ
jgi:uncharacterized metal-binding protein